MTFFDHKQQHDFNDIGDLTKAEAAKVRALVQGDGIPGLAANADASGVVTIRPLGILFAGAGAANATKLLVVSSPRPFYGIEVDYMHLGGGGDCTGLKLCVAVTDDPGPLDYALGGASATLKKMITPKVGGTEYNTLSALGWKAMTFGGAASANIADPGAGLVAVASGDIVPVTPVQAADGLYYALVRVFDGTGPYTRGGYVGFVTGTQYRDDSGSFKIATAYRGGDHVTDPSTWTTGLTPSFGETAVPPLVVRLHGLSTAAKTVMPCGDSRFDAVSEPAPVPQYRSSAFLLGQSLAAAGKPVAIVRACAGGATSERYQAQGLQMLSLCAPSVALYNVYTVNDGTATAAIMDTAKARAVAFVRAALAKGTRPVLVTAWPRGGMTAPELALHQALDVWAQETGIPYISPFAQYGQPDGSWGAWGYDTQHGTQAFYARFAADTADRLIALGYV